MTDSRFNPSFRDAQAMVVAANKRANELAARIVEVRNYALNKGDRQLAAIVAIRHAQPADKRPWCDLSHTCHHWFEDECSPACDRGEHDHPWGTKDCADPSPLNASTGDDRG